MNSLERIAPAKRFLAIFDIDGTLTDSIDVHQRALLRAMRSFHFPNLNTNWGTYHNHTDAWIFHEAYVEAFRRPPSDEHRRAFEDRFETFFGEETSSAPVREIEGASKLVRHLSTNSAWAVVFATGSVRGAARSKLRQADVPFSENILATASEHLTREEIVCSAVGAGAWSYAVSAFERAVSVGDGLWDLETASALGLPFLGVGIGPKAADLRSRGATVLPDLVDIETVVGHLRGSKE